MKKIVTGVVALILLQTHCFSQQNNPWENWSWLIGEWKGEGGGQPGQGEGTFSFSFDLDKKILVRKSHTEYPQPENKPNIVHTDLMIVYTGNSGSPSKSIYFDNEGHIINYTVSTTGKEIIFTSEKTSDSPIFRLTYSLLEKDLVDTRFEISMDGVNFRMYVQGKSRKIK